MVKQERMVHNPRPIREVFFRALFQSPSPNEILTSEAEVKVEAEAEVQTKARYR